MTDQKTTIENLTEDQFDTLFTIVPDDQGEEIRPDLNGLDASSRHVWTLVDGDNGGSYLITGYHWVNRIGYVITEQPWDHDYEVVWGEPYDQSDDDESEE